MARLQPFILIIAVVLSGPCRGQEKDNRKTNSPCLFEPDWRPSHSYDSTLHVNKINVNSVDITIAISQYVGPGKKNKNYILDKGACQGDCSRWAPKVGADYSATVHEQVMYVPSCLKTSAGWVENGQHTELPPTREVSIGFGKMKQETFRYGSTSTFEFYVSYSLPVSVDDPLQHARAWESGGYRGNEKCPLYPVIGYFGTNSEVTGRARLVGPRSGCGSQ